MALVCHASTEFQASSRPMKRLYSETEEKDSEGEESLALSRHCQAVWSGSLLNSRPKFLKLQGEKDPYIKVFLRLFDDPKINEFLWIDSCCKVADRYLIAMAFVYFKRAKLSIDCYTAFNFYTALYLANDMEEDEEDDKYEIFCWAVGKGWMKEYPKLLNNRDRLWKKMQFRAVVSKKTCEEVIAMAPDHFVWTRHRPHHHGGALRTYMKLGTPHYGRTSPPHCDPCLYVAERGVSPCVSRGVSMGEMDFLDEIDLEYRQYCHKPLPVVDNQQDDSFKTSRYMLRRKRED